MFLYFRKQNKRISRCLRVKFKVFSKKRQAGHSDCFTTHALPVFWDIISVYLKQFVDPIKFPYFRKQNNRISRCLRVKFKIFFKERQAGHSDCFTTHALPKFWDIISVYLKQFVDPIKFLYFLKYNERISRNLRVKTIFFQKTSGRPL